MRVADHFHSLELRHSILADRLSMTASVIFLLGAVAGLVLSVMSALNICTSACSEAALFTIFGLSFGWFGVLFFSVLICTLFLRKRFAWMDTIVILLLCAAAGAELQFIWVQKFVIGKWCPLCLTIAAVIYLMTITVVLREWRKLLSRRKNMKDHIRLIATVLLALILGLSGAILGVKKEAEAAELNMFLGKTDSSTIIYFVSDWFCPACRRAEPAIAEIFPKIASIAKIGFVDIPVHPETTNFTPYNLDFLVYQKSKYIQLRKALYDLAKETETPSPEEVQKAVAPYGVKLHQMNYADIASGMNWNENISRTFKIEATPTVVVTNTKTGKHVNLVGREDISYQAIHKAINEVGK